MKISKRQKLLGAFSGAFVIIFAALAWFQDPILTKNIPRAQKMTPKIPLVAIAPVEDSYSRNARSTIEELYNSSRYSEALEASSQFMNSAEASSALKEWLRQQTPIILTALSWQNIQNGRCNEALPTLNQVWNEHRLAEALKGVVYCRHQEQEHDVVVHLAPEYLRLRPDDASMRLLVSDSYESMGEFEEALNILNSEQVTEESAESVRHEAQLMTKKLAESEHQDKTRSEHFQMTFRGAEHAGMVPEALQILEHAWHELGDKIATNIGQRIYEVVLYPDASFRELSHQAPTWSAGVFDGRIRIPITPAMEKGDKSSFRRVLRHEFFHAVLAALAQGRNIPTWLHEGGAQLFECEGQCRPFHFASRPSQFLSADKFSGSFWESSANEASLLYQQSLYLVLNLQYGQLTEDTDPLGTLLQKMDTLEKTDSDGILAAFGLSYSYFYKVSADRWKQRYAF